VIQLARVTANELEVEAILGAHLHCSHPHLTPNMKEKQVKLPRPDHPDGID
jgi:hypothetical protein